jgi:hypothetical protein
MNRSKPEPMPRSLALAKLLDSRYRVPILGVRFGLDPLIGLLPVVGDTITLGMGLIIVADAVRLGVRRGPLVQMVVNLAVDWVVGLVPGLDVIFDVAFKANLRNARILEREWAEGRLLPAKDLRRKARAGI